MVDKANSTQNSDIAIIGIGCLFPDAHGVEEYWHNIRSGKDSIREIPATHWKPADYFNSDPKAPDQTYASTGGFISPFKFNPLDYGISPNAIEATDTTQLLGMVVANEALKDAGYGADKAFNRDRVSCIIGVTGTLELVIPLGARLGHPIWKKALADAGVDQSVADDVVARIAESYVGWQENSFPGLLGNVVAGRIANRLDLGGTNCVVDAACGSSLSALHLACMELQSGKSDMVITGGFDTFNDIFMYMCFSKTPALSPTGHAKPFDRDGDGTILGEGLGAVIIKRLADAERDGDRVYAVIKSLGTSSDGKGQAIYAPSARGQVKCLNSALSQAQVTPDTIELIEAHGTGTKVGDAVEATALCEAFAAVRGETPHCAIGSVKSQIGHTKAAAGAAGLIKATMALYHKVLPATIKVRSPNEALANSPFYLNKVAKPWLASESHPRRAGVSAFGFGGSNFHCILEEHRPEKPAVDWDGKVQVFSFSASTQGGVMTKAQNALAQITNWDSARNTAQASRANFRANDSHRLAIVANAHSNFGELSHKLADQFRAFAGKDTWKSSPFFYSESAKVAPIAMLFPGQGAQRIDMLSDLACIFPEMNDALSAAQKTMADVQDKDPRILMQTLYPPTAFSDVEHSKQIAALQKTDIAQPAIGAVSVGCLHILNKFGVEAAFAAGHSFGELTALYSAGCFSLDTFLQLASMRGLLMAKASGKNAGSMLAVRGTRAQVTEVIADSGLDLVVANHNSPTQVVLSGHRDQLKRAEAVFANHKLATVPLPVGAAFHSPIVADAERPFADYLSRFEFKPMQLHVYSNQTASQYPNEPEGIRSLLAAHLVNQVNFVDQINNMYAAGARIFVEIGPGKILSDLVGKILGDKPDISITALDGKVGHNLGLENLANVLAELAVGGHPVNLQLWDEYYQPTNANKSPGFTVEISGANYVKERKSRPAVTPSILKPSQAQPEDTATNIRAVIPTTPPTVAKVSNITIHKHESLAMIDHKQPHLSSNSDQAATLLQLTQQNLLNLQNLQKQNADLHRQFLENQQASQDMFHALLKQQYELMSQTSIPTTTVANNQLSNPSPVVAVHSQPAPTTIINSKQMNEKAPAWTPAANAIQIPAQPSPATPTQIVSVQAAERDHGALTARILQVVAEKTGYPADMLDVGMSLENDLGIDSIKRVEIFSALHGIVGTGNELRSDELGTLNTLQDIVLRLSGSETAVSAIKAKQPLPAPIATQADAVSSLEIEKDLLAIIADKTGYPADMLNPTMELEADLGIDSIKRVEILSALQDKFPATKGLSSDKLNAMNTVQEIIAIFAHTDTMPGSQIPFRQGAEAHAEPTPTQAVGKNAENDLFAIVAEKTGYPTEMLSQDMQLEADLGIDSIKRVEIFSALQDLSVQYRSISQDAMARFATLGDICNYFQSVDGLAIKSNPDAMAASTEPEEKKNIFFEPSVERLAVIARAIPVLGQTHELHVISGSSVLVAAVDEEQAQPLIAAFTKRGLPAAYIHLDSNATAEIPENLTGLVMLAPNTGNKAVDKNFLTSAFLLAKAGRLALEVGATKQNAFFTTVTFNGGLFGIHGLKPDADPIAGGLSGLTKTASHEWLHVTCKALDADRSIESNELAEQIVNQCLSQDFLEVGITKDGLITLDCELRPFAEERRGQPLGSDDVVIITGGARGVTAEVAVEIAERCQCKLILLGRSPLPETEPHWLLGITDPGAMKKAIIKNADQQLTLKDVEDKYQQVCAWREMETNFNRIRAAGAKFVYRSVDVQDRERVLELIQDAEFELGPVTGFIHGAGVLRDRLIVDKTLEQFNAVYGTKIGGYESIMAAISPSNLKVLALFSSSTGRYGRKGQVDYAIANEVLNKLAQEFSVEFPACRAIAVNWGPWDGGMVTDSLKKLFDSEGIEVIPLKAGARYLVDEMLQEGSQRLTEVVILGTSKSPGAFVNYRDHTKYTPVFSRVVSVNTHPFLASHVIKGKAVVPAALFIEWLAHAALLDHPGNVFAGFDDFKVLKGIVLGSQDSVELHAYVGTPVRSGTTTAIKAELRSLHSNGNHVAHASASILLTESLLDEVDAQIVGEKEPYEFSVETAYNKWLFHGPSLQGLYRISGCSKHGVSGISMPSARPSEWMEEPQRSGWLADPLVLDVAFQLMILWSTEQSGAGCLPVSIKRYRQYRKGFPRTHTIINAAVHKQKNSQTVTSDIEFIDTNGQLVAKIDQYEGIRDRSLIEAFAKRTLMTPESTL